ncbi:MAG: radical SAM protein [Desulfofustis sp.]|jgi:radical SAM superfamily enzyme YgiQ (UPF0313 family)|nr:radical SAM protein [Desulfofustis sp.]
MHYQGNIFRPPSEANSILLQVTTGCSHNTCTFCGMYKQSRFTIKDDATIMADIEFAAHHCRRQHRLFLCDGDALILPQKRLLPILEAIRGKLPWVTRVGTYANARSIALKTVGELEQLRDLGLKIAYMGLESGDDEVLTSINKGSESARIIEMAKKLRAAGIKLSITVILGIAGIEGSHRHAEQSGRALTEIDPEYVGALSLMLVPETELYRRWEQGRFVLPGPREMLSELQIMIRHTDLTRGLFHANHASNYLPIKARLPKDKAATLALIDRALAGEIDLRPEYLRGL